MSRSIRDLRDIINISRLSVYDEVDRNFSDDDLGIISLEKYLLSRTSLSFEESGFNTPSVHTRPSTALERCKSSRGYVSTKTKRPTSAPLIERQRIIRESHSINSGNNTTPLNDLNTNISGLPNFPSKYIPVPPIGEKRRQLKQKLVNKEPMVFDHLFNYLDSTVVNIWLESCNRDMKTLTSFVKNEDIFIEFVYFMLAKLSHRQYCELLDLEFSIFIDNLKYALHTGYHVNKISEDDIHQLASRIIVEYPHILKEPNKGPKSLLDMLVVVSTDKSENYRKLLKNLHCYTLNKQYVQWLLSIRAFGLISLINGIIKFYQNISTLSQTDKTFNHCDMLECCNSERLAQNWLFTAARKNLIEVIDYLYTNQKVDLLKAVDEKKRNLIFTAVVERHIELIYYLSQLDVAIDINQPSENGNNPLLCAVGKDDLEIVKILIELGADVNYWNEQSNGSTPLHLAVTLGSVSMVTFLLNNGGDKSAVMGMPASITPLILAKDLNRLDIVEVLEDN